MRKEGTRLPFIPGIIFSFCLLLISSPSLQGQENTSPVQDFHFITTTDGLSDNHVCQVYQDSAGFIWLATFAGFDRYDGHSFKSYLFNPADSNSISADEYRAPFVEQNGIIWIAGLLSGLHSFDVRKNRFTYYRFQKEVAGSPMNIVYNGLAIDAGGRLWMGTSDGLLSFDQRTKNFRQYRHNPADRSSISATYITSLCMDDSNHLWILSSGGLDKFDVEKSRVIGHVDIPGASSISLRNGDSNLRKGKNGKLWFGINFGVSNGLYCYNTRSGKLRNWPHDYPDPFGLHSDYVFDVLEDRNENIWIAGWGINYLEHATGRFFKTPLQKAGEGQPLVATLCSLEDRSGRIWIGTLNGVAFFDPSYKKFHSIRLDPKHEKIIGSKSALGFCQINDSSILLGTEGGVYLYNTKSGTTSSFEIIEDGLNIFRETSSVWMIYRDSRKNLWFCSAQGLVFYNVQNKSHHWYRNDEKDSASLNAVSCPGFMEDNKGNYWCATWGGGLSLLDPATGKFHSFKTAPGQTELNTRTLGFPMKSPEGMIYFASWGGGLICLDPFKRSLKVYRHSFYDPGSLSCDNAQGLLVSKYGYLWVGTSAGGINAFDPATGRFRAFTIKDGLPSNAIYGITGDRNGNVWVGTLHGISCFTPPPNPFDPKCSIRFRNYDMNDGLPSNSVNWNSAYTDAEGKIYFGTIDEGFFCFDPDDLDDNPFVPPVYITGFRLSNKPVTVGDSSKLLQSNIEATKEIRLNYRQNDFSFTFASLNYIHPEKNQYAYKLDGFNSDWIYADAGNRTANYTNLDPGTYTFRVKASNNDGKWNPEQTTIRVVITPPFWRTAWFRLLCVLALGALLYGIYRYRMQQVVRLQRIRNNIASDLHDDIGSTLNSISIFSEVAKQQAKENIPALEEIGISSRKIIDSMSDIVWTISPENDNFEKIIQRMRSFAYQLLRAKGIELVFRTDATLDSVSLPMLVRKNVYLIFKEAINNIVKYSGASRTLCLINHSNREICLEIRDNGKGFDMNGMSFGNGIKNMRRRADEIKADLNIISICNQGTSIELILKSPKHGMS